MFWSAIFISGFVMMGVAHYAPGLGNSTAWLFLFSGVLIITAAAEFFVHSIQLLGKKLKWSSFMAGTIGELVATLPEFVVIAFLILVDPVTTFIIGLVTVYNNAFFFCIYAYFLPKKKSAHGTYKLPLAVTKAGIQILLAGAGISLILGLTMMAHMLTAANPARDGGGVHLDELGGTDLVVIGSAMLFIFVGYLYTLIKYHSDEEGESGGEPESLTPIRTTPSKDLPDNVPNMAIILGGGAGIIGSIAGGYAISEFADLSLKTLGLNPLITAFILVFFAGSAEYAIIIQSHRKKEYSIALANAFGGVSQGMFLILPFTILALGSAFLFGWTDVTAIPINFHTLILTIMLFPILFLIFQFIEDDQSLSNFEVTSMMGAFGILFYFLFTYS